MTGIQWDGFPRCTESREKEKSKWDAEFSEGNYAFKWEKEMTGIPQE